VGESHTLSTNITVTRGFRYTPFPLPAHSAFPTGRFYRAMLAQSAVMRLLSSVRQSVTIRYRDHIGWNSSKIISRPSSLGPMRSATPNMGDLVQRKHPQN